MRAQKPEVPSNEEKRRKAISKMNQKLYADVCLGNVTGKIKMPPWCFDYLKPAPDISVKITKDPFATDISLA